MKQIILNYDEYLTMVADAGRLKAIEKDFNAAVKEEVDRFVELIDNGAMRILGRKVSDALYKVRPV